MVSDLSPSTVLRRVLVIGLSPEVNRGVVEPLRAHGIDAVGTTDPSRAAIEFNAIDFDLIAFGRAALDVHAPTLRQAFLMQSPGVRFVNVIGPMAVRHIIAELDPGADAPATELRLDRGRGNPSIKAIIYAQCRLTVTLFRRTADTVSADTLGEISLGAGQLVLPVTNEQADTAYSLVLTAEDGRVVHEPCFADTKSGAAVQPTEGG
jgi:hypothetical protein